MDPQSCWTEKSNWVVRKAAQADSDGEDEIGRGLELEDIKQADFQMSLPAARTKERKSVFGALALLPSTGLGAPSSPGERTAARKSVAAGMVNLPDRRQLGLQRRQSMARRPSMAADSPRAALGGRRQSMAGGRRMSLSGRDPRDRTLGPEDIRQMRPKVTAMLRECMQMANFRLIQALAKNQELLQVEARDMLKFEAAWPYETLSPLAWVPHIRKSQLELSGERVLSHAFLKSDSKPVYGRVEIWLHHRSHTAEQDRSPQGQFNPLDSHKPEVLHEAFQQAFAEAKMAQAQAQAAQNEVQRLRGAVDKMKKRSAGSEPTAPCWVAGSPRSASSRDLAQAGAKGGGKSSVSQSAAKREQLRLTEAKLEAQLLDIEKQNLQLEIEIKRQEQRKALLNLSTSPRAAAAAAEALPKLIDCKLPGALKSPRASTPRKSVAAPRAKSREGPSSGKQEKKAKLPRIAFVEVDD
eukprot:gb/GFBE01035125.1/.p1 GENE.gb/GFBE01035125.1/~~gb/GFBE01035125.1/.p1  ORF type:complete len:467 (+),score=110.44 gb/GFBE01035125.1/:1-1401(+)